MKTSPLNKIVGLPPPNKKEEIFTERERRFKTSEIRGIKEIEKEKTPKEKQIIALLNKETNELLEKFELEYFTIPEENIHVIRKEKWATEGEGGVTLLGYGHILIRETDRDIQFAHILFHELVHMKSYVSVQIFPETGEIAPYRHGLRMFPRKIMDRILFPKGESSYFRELNEAVTEEYARTWIMSQIDNPLFAEDFAETKRTREEALKAGAYSLLLNPDIYSLYRLPGDKTFLFGKFGYQPERIGLYQIRNTLFQKYPNVFKSTESVLDLFGKAMLTGKILELSRLMEKTFGKGTMRAVGTP
jgi:hypothetical protein